MKTEELIVVTDLLVNHINGYWPCIVSIFEDLSYDAPPYGTIPDGDLFWFYEPSEDCSEEESVLICEGDLDYDLAISKLKEAGVIENCP